jgi:Spy/CpxP family protein refolding chaperone
MKDLASRLREARFELREAIQSAEATEQSVRAVAAKLADVQADAAVERMKLHGKISPILTAKQHEKIARLQSRLNEARRNAMNRIARRLSQ